MEALSRLFQPFVESDMFQGLLSAAAAQGLGVEQLLGIAVGFAMLMVFFLHTMTSSPPVALDAKEYRPFKLEAITQLSPDTKLLRFALQTPGTVLGLPTGQHISFRAKNTEGGDIVRSYTPITSNDELGYVEFVIKVYFPNVHPKFPEGGAMTMHLQGLQVGDSVEMRGPKGHLDYHGRGAFTIHPRVPLPGRRPTEHTGVRRVGFVAGGSGITPCLQVIREILKDEADTSEIWLLYANQTDKDILLRPELEAMQKEHAGRFKSLHYTLDNPPRRWAYSTGFINTDMCREALPEAGEDAFVFICGPPPMIKFAVEPSLKELGYKEGQWFAF